MSQLKSPDIERAVLGTLLMLDEVRPMLMPKLDPGCFTAPTFRDIFEGVEELYEQEAEIDPLSVEDWLTSSKGYANEDVPNLAGFEALYGDPEGKADLLRDKKVKRELYRELTNLTSDLKKNGQPATDFLSELQGIADGKAGSVQIPGLTMDEIEKRDQNQPKFEQLNLGDTFLDKEFFGQVGSRKGQYEAVLGLSGHGKTHYAVWRAMRYAVMGHKVLYFTMESNDREIYSRFKIYFGSNHENIRIVDKSGVENLTDIIQTARYWKAAWGAEVVVVDYIQRIHVEGINYHNFTKRIETCSNYIADMAVQQNLLCLVLVQPRKLDRHKREGYELEPQAYDIYGSGSVEKDAFMICSLFRPREVEDLVYKGPDGQITGVKPPGVDDPTDQIDKNTVFIRQKKVREGEKYSKFVTFIHDDEGLRRKRSDRPNQQEVPF